MVASMLEWLDGRRFSLCVLSMVVSLLVARRQVFLQDDNVSTPAECTRVGTSGVWTWAPVLGPYFFVIMFFLFSFSYALLHFNFGTKRLYAVNNSLSFYGRERRVLC